MTVLSGRDSLTDVGDKHGIERERMKTSTTQKPLDNLDNNINNTPPRTSARTMILCEPRAELSSHQTRHACPAGPRREAHKRLH
jgi:hypothetical protein